jgi:hypothetical protein
MSFDGAMPQDPAEVERPVDEDADSCALSYYALYRELRGCERENLRLRLLVTSLQAQLAKMPPTPDDVEW